MRKLRILPLVVAALFYHSIASAALLVRFVNPAATPGGNGTSSATGGANRAYASLQEFNDAEATDLVTAGNSFHVWLEPGIDTHTWVYGGWNTSATSSVTARVDPAYLHRGTYTASSYRLEATDLGIDIQSGYIELDALQVTSSRTLSNYTAGIEINNIPAGSFVKLKNLIVRGITDGLGIEQRGIIYQNSSSATVYLVNDLVYFLRTVNGTLTANDGSYDFPIAVKMDAAGTMYGFNNTISSGAFKGFATTAGNQQLRNNIVQNSLENAYGTCESSSSFDNTSDDATFCGSRSRINKNVVFVSSFTYDWHISTNAVVVSSCPSLSTSAIFSFAYDYEGGTRAATGGFVWDCGCDQTGTVFSTGAAAGGGSGGVGSPSNRTIPIRQSPFGWKHEEFLDRLFAMKDMERWKE